MNLLDIISVSGGYGGKNIIRNVSFSVSRGDFLGIIGPNGAGKTTLFRIITKILAPSSGKILFNGQDIKNISRFKLAGKIATMVQSNEPVFSFPVRDFVMLGRFPHKNRFESTNPNDVKVVEKCLAFTDTLSLENRKINELSSGEKQRVFLAQALAQEPEILMLDEPTAFLDIGHQVVILDLLKKLNKENNLTVIMILHDLNMAGQYCKTLVMLNDGAIHACGSPEDVLTYGNIEKVYKTVVVVKENPICHKPYVLTVSKEDIQ